MVPAGVCRGLVVKGRHTVGVPGSKGSCVGRCRPAWLEFSSQSGQAQKVEPDPLRLPSLELSPMMQRFVVVEWGGGRRALGVRQSVIHGTLTHTPLAHSQGACIKPRLHVVEAVLTGWHRTEPWCLLRSGPQYYWALGLFPVGALPARPTAQTKTGH